MRGGISILQEEGKFQYDKVCEGVDTLAVLRIRSFQWSPWLSRLFPSIVNIACFGHAFLKDLTTPARHVCLQAHLA